MWYVVRVQLPLPVVSVVSGTHTFINALQKAINYQQAYLQSNKYLPVEIESLRKLHKIVDANKDIYQCHYYIAKKEELS